MENHKHARGAFKDVSKMPDAQESQETDIRILYALRKIIRAVDIDSKKLSNEFNITGPQLVTLRAIVNDGDMTSTEISKRIHLSTSTIVGILDRLQGHGLIKRKRDIKDRRLVNISPTDEGKELVEKMPNALLYRMGAAVEAMPEQDQETLAGLLEQLSHSLEKQSF